MHRDMSSHITATNKKKKHYVQLAQNKRKSPIFFHNRPVSYTILPIIVYNLGCEKLQGYLRNNSFLPVDGCLFFFCSVPSVLIFNEMCTHYLPRYRFHIMRCYTFYTHYTIRQIHLTQSWPDFTIGCSLRIKEIVTRYTQITVPTLLCFQILPINY